MFPGGIAVEIWLQAGVGEDSDALIQGENDPRRSSVGRILFLLEISMPVVIRDIHLALMGGSCGFWNTVIDPYILARATLIAVLAKYRPLDVCSNHH